MKIFLFIVFISVALISCVTASGPVFKGIQAGKNDSIVYIYRESSIVGGALSVDVYVNEKYEISLDNNGYFPVRVKPGDVSIKVKGGIITKEMIIHAHAKKKYYVRTGGLAGYGGDLLLVNMETKIGSQQIADNRLQEAEK